MEENKAQKNRLVIPVLLALIIVAGCVFGISKFLYYSKHEDTDDAQIDGDLSAVVARVGGYVDSINFEDNQRVIKGQLLVKLEDKEYHLKLEQALAAQKLAGSKIGVSKTQVATSQSSSLGFKALVDVEKAKLWQAEQEYTRYSALIRNGSVPQQVYDKVKAERDAAAALYKSANDQYHTAISQISNNQSQLKVTHTALNQQQVDVDFANLMLSYTNINAPVTGIVTKRRVQNGQLVQAGQTLFSVIDENNLYVTANFKETQMEHIRPGQDVRIKVDAYPDLSIEGKVYNFAGTTGAKMALLPPDNSTGNFVKVVQRIPVKIKITTSKEIIDLIRPGMNVEVSVSIKK
ncbi:HlyD family secretion protein [Pedobacter caeni]|uniref:Membrane fusion protein, multidrug efflux system n=1 Tax=Pedobacter caeni TaxID=288992 RepID=A0A1M4ZYX7_9SPHI|nr:HlyD family secretion protein [Pedobacter caeni]SHF23057.1 membrane fusion protein, multidrug efflux system [Pedobacter caeni]